MHTGTKGGALVAAGIEKLNWGRLDEALRLFRKAETLPRLTVEQTAGLMYGIGRCLRLTNKLEESVTYLDEAADNAAFLEDRLLQAKVACELAAVSIMVGIKTLNNEYTDQSQCLENFEDAQQSLDEATKFFEMMLAEAHTKAPLTLEGADAIIAQKALGESYQGLLLWARGLKEEGRAFMNAAHAKLDKMPRHNHAYIAESRFNASKVTMASV
ncbi:MAG: hypothetical protein V4611_03195 [Patescibacteria group bacterium]